MQHAEITAAVVEEVERLLAEGIDAAVVSARAGVSPYVAGIIAHECNGKPRPRATPRSDRRIRNVHQGVDATTVRMIQRMLDVGILRQGEIAREAGVASSTVREVADGRRPAITRVRPVLDEAEQFLSEPIRCSVCGRLISVIPCRACAATRQKHSA